MNHVSCNRKIYMLLLVIAYPIIFIGCSSTNPATNNAHNVQRNDGLTEAVATHKSTLVATPPVQSPSPTALLTQGVISSPTNTVLPTETPVATPPRSPSRGNLGTIYKVFTEAYAWSNLLRLQGELQIEEGSQNTITSSQAPHSPANGQLHAFSHYSDQIAYWTRTDPSEFWISDVAYERPHQILADAEGTYVRRGSLPTENLQQLQWSPDDRHLLVYTSSRTTPHLIYHLETKEIEEWYWLCQNAIVSPRTNELAVLCIADDHLDFDPENSYAIMEWGGDIWYTPDKPDTVLSPALIDGTIPWRFSTDGQLIAYFDPHDPGAHLLIADAEGNVRRLLPNSSLLQQDQRITEFETQYYKSWPERQLGFFRWSPDNELILAYALGDTDHPCRLLQYSEESQFNESPCWQVVEVTTGEVLWTEKNSADTLFRDEIEKSRMRLVQAEFSPNGQMVAVRGQHLGNYLLAVIELDTFVAHRLFPLPLTQFYWASTTD